MKIYFPLLFILLCLPGYSQTKSDSIGKRDKALSVFLDCNYCDMDYLRTELPIINYVRDRKEADVDIVASSIQTGSKGQEFTFVFVGMGRFAGQKDTLKTNATSFATDDAQRKIITQTLKLGLARYIAKTPYADKLNISFTLDTTRQNVNVAPGLDKWKSWVFTVGGFGNFNGQQLTGTANVNGVLQATKVTPDWKVSLGYGYGYNYGYYIISSDSTITSISQSSNLSGLYVKSINEHFSWGMNVNVNTSTFNNLNLQEKIQPGIEYSIFPYSIATHKLFRLLYYLTAENTKYEDTTIYGKIHTLYLGEELLASINYKEPWGSLFMSLDGSHYFYDFRKNNLTFSTGFSLNLFEGFTLAIGGAASIVNNEIYLPANGATEAEILLSTKALPTPYQYNFFVGIKYSFGSIYNDIVNPRFSPNSYNLNFSF